MVLSYAYSTPHLKTDMALVEPYPTVTHLSLHHGVVDTAHNTFLPTNALINPPCLLIIALGLHQCNTSQWVP